MTDVVIVDYGAGNLRSVARAVTHAGVEPVVSSDPEAIDGARAVILPGVGAAADTMANLRAARLVEPIREYITADRPFLGVCMGMQALFDVSEEGGEHECLGALPGRIVRFPRGLTVPHMGWNTLRIVRPHPVLEGIEDGTFCYFVHSYYPAPAERELVIAETEYEVAFASVVGRGNLVATQFHPEKSGAAGLRIYANFLRLALETGSIAPPSEAIAAEGGALVEVIPAIDIRGGRCVRLHQGDYERETVFDDDPVAVAARWTSQGAKRIHVVDLDGAREGRQANAETTRRIIEGADAAVQIGGGVRDVETLRATLELGAARVVLGTAAVRDRALLSAAIALAGERLIVSVDARDGFVRVEGWTEGSEIEAAGFVRELAALGVQRIVFTDIARDGVRGGPNLDAYESLVADNALAVIAAGGVSSVEDVRHLEECGVEAAIIGRALYTGEILLPDALAAVA